MKNSAYCDLLNNYRDMKRNAFFDICSSLSKFHSEKINMRLRGFNDFNYLNLLKGFYDENSHSKIIAEFLNPNGSHYQGRIFLDNFFRLIGLKDKDDFTVITERYIECSQDKSNNDNNIRGRIDIYMESKSRIIILENKINAGEQEFQIKKYIECLKLEKDIYDPDRLIVIYLSKHGDDPSDYSLGDFKIKGDYIHDSQGCKVAKYINISYRKTIKDWIHINLSDIENISNLREVFLQYLDAVKNILGEKESRMNLKDFLLLDENKYILSNLIENYDDFKKHIEQYPECKEIFEEERLDDVLNNKDNGVKFELRFRVAKKIKELLVVYANSHGYLIEANEFLNGAKWSPIDIYKSNWNDKDGKVILSFSIENSQYNFWGDFYFGIRKQSEKTPYVNKNLNNDILRELVHDNSNMKTSNGWLLWKSFTLPMYRDEFSLRVLKEGEESIAREYVNTFVDFIKKNSELVDKYVNTMK